MWLPRKIVRDVDHVARIRYINMTECQNWNAHRQDGELRLLTGWEWIERDGTRHRQGYKSMSVCYRDAWYILVKGEEPPGLPVKAKQAKVKKIPVIQPERSQSNA